MAGVVSVLMWLTMICQKMKSLDFIKWAKDNYINEPFSPLHYIMTLLVLINQGMIDG